MVNLGLNLIDGFDFTKLVKQVSLKNVNKIKVNHIESLIIFMFSKHLCKQI
jgi:hypothetical protein